MTPTQFLTLIGLIKNETAPNGNTKTRIGDAILESSKQANTYSTDETVIGTWIDGKPIYRKVLSIDTTDLENGVYNEDDNPWELIHNLNIERRISGFVVLSVNGSDVPNTLSLEDAFFAPSNYNETGSYYDNPLNENSQRLNLNCFAIVNVFPSFDLVLEYTKTTDSIPE